MAKNVRDDDGTIPEKYNTVTGSHDVFVEHGNKGTNFPAGRPLASTE